MATNLETEAKPTDSAPTRPSLKLTGLHIRNLKSIASLDLPEDGLGWDGPMPDMMMVGGINGSGKTTLLELLVRAFGAFNHLNADDSGELQFTKFRSSEVWVEYCISFGDVVDSPIRFVVGDEEFVGQHRGENAFGHVIARGAKGNSGPSDFGPPFVFGEVSKRLQRMLVEFYRHSRSDLPSVVYFPSEQRKLVVHQEPYKLPAKVEDPLRFLQRWVPPEKWRDTLEARLYGMRWEDLNAKEEGRPDEATRFGSYAQAFNRFFDGRKQIKWHQAELVVETKDGTKHGLEELSSGEKQVILFMGELLYRWRPGSLIVIDEPELHLHESFQTRLWEALLEWQQERGGQVIVATQSGHLFRIAHDAMKVVLGGRRS